MQLSGRVALVTGVSRRAGIGFAIARRLLELGADVFVQSWTPHDERQPHGADPGGIEAVLGELREAGRVEHAEADFAGPEAPAAVFAAARAAFGHVDVLVVDHARSGSGGIPDLTATSSTRSCTRTCGRRSCSSRSSPPSTTAARVGA